MIINTFIRLMNGTRNRSTSYSKDRNDIKDIKDIKDDVIAHNIKTTYELERIKRQNLELIWARVWDDTKVDIEWLKELPGISPGRWAVGYNYIYIMTRILCAMKPAYVLDLGLGVSSTLISEYFRYSCPVAGKHLIIEQDKDWADFYLKNNRLSQFSTISVNQGVSRFIGDEEYIAYKDFMKTIGDTKYSLISVDGPKRSIEHSRRDIIDCIPNNLEDSFVIVFDDANSKGVKETMQDIESRLRSYNIPFCTGWYYGMTDCYIITSEDNKYYCSL